jgi:hypothetical protein
MTTATFLEDIAARDLLITVDTDFDTPAPDLLPNGDAATDLTTTVSYAYFAESAGEFALPWGVDDWSVEAWLRWTGSPAGALGPILGRHASAMVPTAGEWQLCQSGAGTPVARFRVTFADPAAPWAQSDVAFTTGAWHHIVFTLNTSLGSGAVAGREIKAYKNATLDSTTSCPSTSVGTPSLSGPRVVFGAAGGGAAPNYLEVAKLAIYRRLLTGGEVTDHYNAMTT